MFFKKSSNTYAIYLNGRHYTTFRKYGRVGKVLKDLSKSAKITFPDCFVSADRDGWNVVKVVITSKMGRCGRGE